jgi:hypothetical protein
MTEVDICEAAGKQASKALFAKEDGSIVGD